MLRGCRRLACEKRGVGGLACGSRSAFTPVCVLELVRLNVTPQFDARSDKEEKDAELGRGKLGGRRKAIFLTAGLTLLFILRLTYR